MEKKNVIILIALMALLIVCILLMATSLLIGERIFGRVSGYIAIASIVITIVGVIMVIRSDKTPKA